MFVGQDFVLNGKGHGPVGGLLGSIHYDPGLLRPYFDNEGTPSVLVNTGETRHKKKEDGSIVTNKNGQPVSLPVYEKRHINDLLFNHGMYQLVQNATVLSKEQWVTLSNIVRMEYRKRLRAWSDLMNAASYGGFDGMSTMMLEYQTVDDPGEAVMDLDGMTESRADQNQFKLEGLPLFITHSDFWFSERMLAISRKNGTPLNTRAIEWAGRRVAEMVEKVLIGTVTGPTLGSQASGAAGIAYGRTPSVYGYTNHPSRSTKTDITAPTTGGWTPDTLLGEVLAMRDTLLNNNFFGPYMLYHSTDWDQYLDNDYYVVTTSGGVAPTQTLRSRLRQIEGVQDVRRLDFLTNTFTLLLIQMTSDVAQAVNGMDVTTVQWPSMGGMRTNFKVMTIQAPLITPDYQDRLGIVHGTTS